MFLFLFLLLDLSVLLSLVHRLNYLQALTVFPLTILQVIPQFPFQDYVILRVTALDELVDPIEVDHEVEGLGIPRKVLLHRNKRHLLTELEPDKNKREKYTS